jgi:hypothetical protein
MNPSLEKILRWSPRVLGLLIALFTGIFSFDAFEEGVPFWQSLLPFFMHLLVPTLLLLVGLALAWRWPLAGAVIFLGWAVAYPITTLGKVDPLAYVLISGIPALVGLLFLADWLTRRGRPASAILR